MTFSRFRHFLLAPFSALVLSAIAAPALAQGCLAAHTNTSMQGCLLDTQTPVGDLLRNHPVTVEVDWRSFSSFRHFSGEKENTQRALLNTQIKNHQNLYNINVSV